MVQSGKQLKQVLLLQQQDKVFLLIQLLQQLQLLEQQLNSLAADNAVLDPKLADALVAMGEREPVVRVGVREKSGVKIKAKLLLFCPVDPALEVVWFQCTTLDCFSAGLGVGRMQIEAVIARDERECLGGIGSQFVGGSGFAGVVAGDG